MLELSGMDIVGFNSVESTQKVAREFIADGKNCHKMVIMAKEQTGGFGRLEREWFSPKGGVWISIIFQKPIPVELIQGFSIRYGLYLASFAISGVDLKVRWPNDLMIGDKKVGGILTEFSSKGNKLNHLIIGLGLNVNIPKNAFPDELRSTATSFYEELNKEIDIIEIEQFVIEVTAMLFAKLENETVAITNLKQLWKDLSYTYQKEIEIIIDNKKIIGTEVGICESGELIIELKDGTRKTFSEGEINLLRKK
jgi:BirA family biotin operon repressor/biotin-[acetyl-CoA-carboxylase] ligase